MADTKASSFSTLTAANIATNDYVPLVDTSATGNAKASVDEFAQASPFADRYAAKTQSNNAQTGTSYTLVLADAGKFLTLSNASAVTLTVPPNSSVAFPTGTVIEFAQLGAGQVTVSPGSGVTIRVPGSLGLKLVGQYSAAALKKLNTDEWLLMGHLTA